MEPLSPSSILPSYVLNWRVDGHQVEVDYFNIFFSTRDQSPMLIGHSALPTFVTSVENKYVLEGKITVIIQPILSATGLPQNLATCTNVEISLPEFGSA